MAPRISAKGALLVLTGLNLLNYVDRYVPSAVKDLYKSELGLTDAETSWPFTAFVLVYMLTSPIFGDLADRWSRRVLIALGIFLWSIATALGSLATGFWTFFLARALVGVGEAAYATIAPSMISDFYPREQRNRAMTIFYVAIPIGAAIGFSLGGALGHHFGWRAAFLISGLPGIFMAFLVLLISDPPRGAHDNETPEPAPAWPEALRRLFHNPTYLYAVAGYTAVTFASGAMADWFPTFLSRSRGLSLTEAGQIVGGATVAGGILGTLAGGFLADKLGDRIRQPYLALSAWATFPSALFALLVLRAEGKTEIACLVFLAQFFLWFYNGPINALLVNCVPSGMRARAFALSILAIHLLGDAVSPTLVGLISDHTGDLTLGLFLIPGTLALGALIWLIGWRRASTAASPPAA